MIPEALRCEFLSNPMGIGIRVPRLFWKFTLEEGRYGAKQTAYQIQSAGNLKDLIKQKLIWDSGKVEEGNNNYVSYGGKLPASRERVYWRVRVWDENKKTGTWSEPAFFEMGLLHSSDWRAEWINPEEETDPSVQYPASYIRKKFHIKNKAAKARLYITSCGVYEAWINGKRVGDQVFTPGATDYKRRLQYQTYDVTDLLEEGDNAIGAVVGDGWYRGSLGNNGNRNVYGKQILLLAQLEIEAEDGERSVIITDESWKTTKNGPIRLSDLQDGEFYDAGKEMPDWSKGGFNDSDWFNVTVTEKTYTVLTGCNSVPVREKEHFTPRVLNTSDGNTVLDFGQNLAGYVHFKIKGESGRSVTLLHGEALDENGNFTMEHLNNTSRPKDHPLKQEIQYKLKGGMTEEYQPHFTIHGFRYVLLKNWPEKVKAENFTAIAVYSDMVQTGEFQCSNELINKLVHNTLWSQKSNFLDVPTDCPQRERAAWTGDAQVFAETGSILMDTAAFYSKWMKDLAVSQLENGMVLNIAPPVSDGKDKKMKFIEGSSGWGDAAVIIPWTMYRMYGDKRILEEQWKSMKAWVDYEAKCARRTHWSRKLKINPYRKYTWDTKFHWGEWTEPASENYKGDNIIKNVIFSVPEVATAYFAYSSGLLSRCAEVIGKEEEAKKYRELSEKVKKAYIYNFTDKGKIESSRQCLYVRPLALELLPKENRVGAAKKLNELIIKNDYHIGTGFLSTPFICKVLCDYGYVKTAYRLLEQTEMPGWLYPVTKGATTIWEHWDGINQENIPRESLNHYSPGAVIGWLFQYTAGIHLDRDAAGYNNFVIAPRPGGTLKAARGVYESISGRIESAWRITEKDDLKLKIQIPPNTKAKVILPCKDREKVRTDKGITVPEDFFTEDSKVCILLCSGNYEFTCMDYC